MVTGFESCTFYRQFNMRCYVTEIHENIIETAHRSFNLKGGNDYVFWKKRKGKGCKNNRIPI